MTAVLEGRVVGPWELLERVGGGGQAVVHRARHATLGRLAALKLVHRQVLADPSFRVRFRREQGLALAPEADPERGVGPDLAVDELQRRQPAEGGVARPVDDGLPPSPDALQQLPGADDAALEDSGHRRAGRSARAVDWAHARAVW